MKLKSADAVEALLKRFTFATDPSITDQEEKELVFEGIVGAGREAIEPVRAFAAKAESVAQPLRILKAILDEEELIDELLVWLERWDTEYAKFIDPKLQILQMLEEYQNPKIRPAVEPFLQTRASPPATSRSPPRSPRRSPRPSPRCSPRSSKRRASA